VPTSRCVAGIGFWQQTDLESLQTAENNESRERLRNLAASIASFLEQFGVRANAREHDGVVMRVICIRYKAC
jgi:hypothetical protein